MDLLVERWEPTRGLNGFARRSISRGVPGARLKGWLASKSVGRN